MVWVLAEVAYGRSDVGELGWGEIIVMIVCLVCWEEAVGDYEDDVV